MFYMGLGCEQVGRLMCTCLPSPVICRGNSGRGSMGPRIFTELCLASPWVGTSTMLRWTPWTVSSIASLAKSQLLPFPMKNKDAYWLLFAPFHTSNSFFLQGNGLVADIYRPFYNLCHITVPAVQLSIYSLNPLTFFFLFFWFLITHF